MLALEGRYVFKLQALLFLTICFISTGITYGDSNDVTIFADISTYEFDTDQSYVIQTGGFAGVDEIYPIEGYFQLSLDFNTEEASFELVDANLLEPTGFLPTENLNELFNMTELTGIVFDDTVIVFWGEVSDNPETEVLITVILSDDIAYIYGKTIPPACCDYFYFDLDAVAKRKYSGGTGEPNEPYQIATADDLITLGECTEDYDKHFILTADIDLDPNLPGRKVFDRAVIAPDTDPNDTNGDFKGTSFTGVFDGNGHSISNLIIEGDSYLGLFGQIKSGAKISNLGLETVDVNGTGDYVGGLVGYNYSTMVQCYSTSSVSGNWDVGGLVGCNSGTVTQCYSTSSVSGNWDVGGLVGYNYGTVIQCYSTSSVSGNMAVGGLVGFCYYRGGIISMCYSSGTVSGDYSVGGLLGYNYGFNNITQCYSTSSVSGNWDVGGLVGYFGSSNDVMTSFWNIETSGQSESAEGIGLTTAEMHDPNMFIAAGWNFINLPDGPGDIWAQPEGSGYPILWWVLSTLPELPTFSGGTGQPNDPYLISAAEELNSIGYNPRLMDAHFKLIDDVNLAGVPFYSIGITDSPYSGVFNGNGYTISNFIYDPNSIGYVGPSGVGLFGYVRVGTIKDLGLIDPNINAELDGDVGPLVGCLSQGYVTNCYVSGGNIRGNGAVGGLVCRNSGRINTCYSTSTVCGNDNVGGLVGFNSSAGSIDNCYSTGKVTGDQEVGGLVGHNYYGCITNCYSTSVVNGKLQVGGLVGCNRRGVITQCYSTGIVSGEDYIGGLIGRNGNEENVISCLWDRENSGLSISNGGVGLTTAEMMDPYMLYLNGFANDPNWILDAGRDYPRLAWEGTAGQIIPESIVDWLVGQGTEQEPYRIDAADQLILLSRASVLWDKHFILVTDIDLDPNLPGRKVFSQAIIQFFSGVFDGNGHTISHLTIEGSDYLGLFGQTDSEARISNLGLEAVDINGNTYVGGLVGYSSGGSITMSYSTGTVSGNDFIGGLVGYSRYKNSITASYSTGTVSGDNSVGGLVGYNGNHCDIIMSYSSGSVIGDNDRIGGLVGYNDNGSITMSYSIAAVCGNGSVGGLVGTHLYGETTNCYSTGVVSGKLSVGGLVGYKKAGVVTQCYSTGIVSGEDYIGGLIGINNEGNITSCLWDMVTSGQDISDGGIGKTTVEMQTENTFTDDGWDFIGETDNGTDDIWWIDEGLDYPRLWWEAVQNEQ